MQSTVLSFCFLKRNVFKNYSTVLLPSWNSLSKSNRGLSSSVCSTDRATPLPTRVLTGVSSSGSSFIKVFTIRRATIFSLLPSNTGILEWVWSRIWEKRDLQMKTNKLRQFMEVKWNYAYLTGRIWKNETKQMKKTTQKEENNTKGFSYVNASLCLWGLIPKTDSTGQLLVSLSFTWSFKYQIFPYVQSILFLDIIPCMSD